MFDSTNTKPASTCKSKNGNMAQTVCESLNSLGRGGKPARLGIMGGTFDPIHTGHLCCAEQARSAFNLNAVLFVPAGSPAYKQNKKVTPATQRLEMCKLATKSNPAFFVSDIEIKRPGITYTIDTLKQLRAQYPKNVELVFITATDAAATVYKWRRAQEIAKLAHIVCVSRPGCALEKQQLEANNKQAENINVEYIERAAVDVSSSTIRNMVKAGMSIKYLVPDEVIEYIHEQQLYETEA